MAKSGRGEAGGSWNSCLPCPAPVPMQAAVDYVVQCQQPPVAHSRMALSTHPWAQKLACSANAECGQATNTSRHAHWGCNTRPILVMPAQAETRLSIVENNCQAKSNYGHGDSATQALAAPVFTPSKLHVSFEYLFPETW